MKGKMVPIITKTPKRNTRKQTQDLPDYEHVVRSLRKGSDPKKAKTFRTFFKNPDEHIFIGVPVKIIRQLAKEFQSLPFEEIKKLMKSKVHDERTLANAILVLRFAKGNDIEKEEIFDFYMTNRKYMSSWADVDSSAPYIVGAFLMSRDKDILFELASSNNLWDRRIAIVSTWWFIRKGEIEYTLQLAELLLNDKEDLIHKAVGWMLREAEKCDSKAIRQFLKKHHKNMPRTTLRYAIERFPAEERILFLKGFKK